LVTATTTKEMPPKVARESGEISCCGMSIADVLVAATVASVSYVGTTRDRKTRWLRMVNAVRMRKLRVVRF
jgi:hypothetical protein